MGQLHLRSLIALVALLAPASALAWSPAPTAGDPIRAALFVEIVDAVHAKRAECGAAPWTAPAFTPGAPVSAAAIRDIRAAARALYEPPRFLPGSPSFPLPEPQPGVPIRAGYVAELRAAIDGARCAACDYSRCTWSPAGCCVGSDGNRHLSLDFSCPGQPGCPAMTRCDETAACPDACSWTSWFGDGACGTGACSSPRRQPEKRDCVDSTGRAVETDRRCYGSCDGCDGGWTGWTAAGSCGMGSCPATQRPEVRRCPTDPDIQEERCVDDSSCVPCGDWTAQGCGQGCSSGRRKWTRTCPPGNPSETEDCRPDPECAGCEVGSWAAAGSCGGGGCGWREKPFTRTVSPEGCDASSECRPDPSCDECRSDSDCQNGCDACGCTWRSECVEGQCRLSDNQRPNPYCCFLAGTKVLTPDGERPIETLRAGDRVLGMDPATRRRVEARVVANREGKSAERLDLQLDDGTRIAATPQHPFWDPRERRFKPIADFQPGDPLAAVDASGSYRTPVIVRKEIAAWNGPVYSLSVEGPGGERTYFANGVLVHNKCPRTEECGGEGATPCPCGELPNGLGCRRCER